MGEKQRINLALGPEHTAWDKGWSLRSLSLSFFPLCRCWGLIDWHLYLLSHAPHQRQRLIMQPWLALNLLCGPG